MKFEAKRLGDIAEIIGGGTPSTKDPSNWDGDIPWLTPKDLSSFEGIYVDRGSRSITELGFKTSSAKMLPVGTVLYTSRAPIGYVAIASNSISTNQGFKSLILKDGYVPEFVFYLLKASKSEIESHASGGTFAEISAKALSDVVLQFPPKIQQEAIAKLLKSLDEKIATNNALSKTLEDIAQTIFKSWFTDFDPVKAKMAGEKPAGMDAATAALFPDSMEDSEIGVIPKGWEVKTLGDICATTIGGLWGNDDESPENPDSYQCIRGVDMDDLKASGFAPRVPVRWDKTHNFSKRLLSGTQILIAGSGAGPVAKSLLWDEAMNNLFPQPVVFSNFVKRFECNSNEMASFVSSILSTMYESREIFTFVNGTSVPNLQDRELLTGKKVAVPSIDLLRAFDNIKRTSIKRKYSGENSNLVAIRDSLLPRLISGELQIPEEMLAS